MPDRNHRHGRDHAAARGRRSRRIDRLADDSRLSRVARAIRARKILIPDSAHGTNPATAAMAGYAVENLKSNARGMVDVEALAAQMNEDVAALMLTNPNTLGVFEQDIHKIADILHAKGGLLYMDGANMNALVGKVASRRFWCRRDAPESAQDVFDAARRRRSGFGAGGDEENSRAVSAEADRSQSRMGRWLSNTTVRSRSGACAPSTATSACSFARWPTRWPTARMGCGKPPKTRCSMPTTSAKDWKALTTCPTRHPSMHEVVFSDRLQAKKGVRTMDIAKRLIDYGFHPYTTRSR